MSSKQVNFAGVPLAGVSAVQTLAIGGTPTSGKFRLKLGPFVTSDITFSTTNGTLITNIQAALRALPNINGAHVNVAVGSMTAGVGTASISFGGNLANLNVSTLTVQSNTLNGSGTVAVTVATPGVTATGRGTETGGTLRNTLTGDTYLNSGTPYSPVWTLSSSASSYPVKKAALGSPALGSDTAVHAAVTLSASTQSVTTAITNPDIPRNVVVKGNASGIAGNVVITGTNAKGVTITDTIALNGTASVAGTKAFASVASVSLPAKTNASGDTVSIGVGAALGIGAKLSYDTVLRAFLNGVKEGTAPTVAFSSVALESNTVTLNGTLAGTPVMLLYVNDTTA